MKQATERSSKGFGTSAAGQPDSTDAAFRAQVGAELAKLRQEVRAAAEGQTEGIAGIAAEYQDTIQPVADEASQLIYDMLSGGTFYRTVAQNVGQMMAAHPRGERVALGKPTLKPLSLKPLQQGMEPAYLSSADGGME
jgi:hypothetical protein